MSRPEGGSSTRVTVVVPTFRRPARLERALGSVFAQTLMDWELIIIDDNGADTEAQLETKRVVCALGKDSRVKYVVHDTNRGGGAARNTGIRLARGQFVAFLDDDDAWEAEKLAIQVGRLEAEDASVALAYCRSRIVDEGTGESRLWPTDGRSHGPRSLLRRNAVGSTSLVVCRRPALVEVGGFDETLPAKQDIDLYIRLASRYEFVFVDRVLNTTFRHSGASIGKDLEGAIRAHEAFYAKHRTSIEADPDVFRYRQLALAKLLLKARRNRRARGILWRLWRAQPFEPRLFGYLMLAHGVPRAPFASLARRVRRSKPLVRRTNEDGV